MNKNIITAAKDEIKQEQERSKIERAKEILKQIVELESCLNDLYQQLEDIKAE